MGTRKGSGAQFSDPDRWYGISLYSTSDFSLLAWKTEDYQKRQKSNFLTAHFSKNRYSTSIKNDYRLVPPKGNFSWELGSHSYQGKEATQSWVKAAIKPAACR
ncbi:MAG: hypothetical protein R2828_07930 [Saprospiraceae bacterium]